MSQFTDRGTLVINGITYTGSGTIIKSGTESEIDKEIARGRIREGEIFVITDDEEAPEVDATDVTYDNTTSEMLATNVKTAIDELDARLDGISMDEVLLSDKSSENQAIRFGIDTNGNYGYYKVGADSVTPFKNPTNATLSNDGVLSVVDSNSTELLNKTFSNSYNAGFNAGRTLKSVSKTITVTQNGTVGNQNFSTSFSELSKIVGIVSAQINGNIYTTAECYINTISYSGTTVSYQLGWGDGDGMCITDGVTSNRQRSISITAIGY